MKTENRILLISALAAAIGGALGAVSGSNYWLVVAIVSAVFGILAAWGLKSLIR